MNEQLHNQGPSIRNVLAHALDPVYQKPSQCHRQPRIRRYTPPRNHHRASLPTLALILIPLSLLSSQTHAQINLGCYLSNVSPMIQDPSTVTLPSGLTSPATDIYMSHGACFEHCHAVHSRYAYLQEGTLCFCSQDRPPDETKVAESHCNTPCAGYPLEMCGSRLAGSDSADSAVYATVMLVQNTLPDISNQPQNPDQTKRDNSNVDLPIAKITATTEEHVEPHAKGQKKQSGSEEADDNGKDDGEDDGEDDSTDNDDEDNEDDEDDLADHRSGKALAAHPAEGSSENMSISSIPVASTAVAVACLLGVGAFLVYLGRKRKRERVRAAWVESVFGPGTQGGGADQGVDPFGRHQSQGPQRYSSRGYGRTPSPDDLESVSDLHSEMMMMDRRGSSQYNSNNSRQSSVVQNNFSPSVVVPAPVRDTRGASSAARRGYSYHHPRELESPPDFMRRQAGFAQTPKSQQQSQKHYMEFFGQNDGEEDAELTQLDEDELVPITPEASLGHPAVSVPRRPVSALVHKAPSPVHPLAFADQARSYRAIPQCSPFDQVENSDPFHDATTPESKSRSRHRPIPFEYRRTQAFANDESLPRFPTHVLEDSDTASIDTEVPASLPRHGSASHSNGGGIGVIKEQLRRLSTPYVKAIRQEQVGDASVKSTGEYDIEAITEEQGHGVMNPMPGPSPASERRSKAKHRQVHSGSLASFRGLDDQPQLRVMNPDH